MELELGLPMHQISPRSVSNAGGVPWMDQFHASVLGLEKAGFGEVKVICENADGDLSEHMSRLIRERDLQEPFYVMDIGVVVRLFQQWREAMPRVTPFYAVKCNPSPVLLTVLAKLGAGFDCASKAEIATVKALGVSSNRIIYANPCKMVRQIKYAAAAGVHMTTFDCEGELYKIKNADPNAQLLIRLRADDPTARCPLGVKYGALPSEGRALLKRAAALELKVVGAAFHVGSGAADATAYVGAIEAAKELFDEAEKLGIQFSVLDIGGGLTAGGGGGSGLQFGAATAAINGALAVHFPSETGVEIIAEPGRYFAERPFTLATTIFGLRQREDLREYWINDGLYGSMNCLLYDHAGALNPKPLRLSSVERKTGDGITKKPMFRSTVFGPTCDSLDTVMRDAWLPELAVGDWLIFNCMGAYTAAAGSAFNGFATSEIPTFYVYSVGSHDFMNWEGLDF